MLLKTFLQVNFFFLIIDFLLKLGMALKKKQTQQEKSPIETPISQEISKPANDQTNKSEKKKFGFIKDKPKQIKESLIEQKSENTQQLEEEISTFEKNLSEPRENPLEETKISQDFDSQKPQNYSKIEENLNQLENLSNEFGNSYEINHSQEENEKPIELIEKIEKPIEEQQQPPAQREFKFSAKKWKFENKKNNNNDKENESLNKIHSSKDIEMSQDHELPKENNIVNVLN